MPALLSVGRGHRTETASSGVAAHPGFEIDLGMDRVAGREGHAHLRQVELRDRTERADGAGGVADEHLLHADRERDIGGTRRDLEPGAAQRGGGTGAGILDIDDRDAGDA